MYLVILYMIEIFQNKSLRERERERTKRSSNKRTHGCERVAEAS